MSSFRFLIVMFSIIALIQGQDQDSGFNDQNEPESSFNDQNQPESSFNDQNQPESGFSDQNPPESIPTDQNPPDTGFNSDQNQPESVPTGQNQPEISFSRTGFVAYNDQQRTKYQCWHQGRYWPEGAQIDRGRYWYECRTGQEEPMGCFDDSNRRMKIGETFVSSAGYEHTCTLDTAGYLTLPLTACVIDGQRHIPGDSFDESNGKYWLTCQRINDKEIRAEVTGCLSQGRRLNLNDTIENGDLWYICSKKRDGGVSLCTGGCIQDGRRYNIGDQFSAGSKTYYCKVENGKCQKVCISGCDQTNSGVQGFSLKESSDPASSDFVGTGGFREGYCFYEELEVEKVRIPPDTYTIWYSDQLQRNIAIGCQSENNDGNYDMIQFKPEELVFKARGLSYYAPRKWN